MQEKFPVPSEHAALEADIKELAQEILRERERPESSVLSEQEILKRSVAKIGTEPVGVPGAHAISNPLPSYADDSPPETKLEIEYLLDTAYHKGIAKANSEAKKAKPFVLDAFHDALAGRLYPELKKRGILK